MRQLLLLFAGLSQYILVCAQSEARFQINLNQEVITDKTELPFSAIIIIDARFDQTNVGCIAREVSFKAMSQFKEIAVFPDSLKYYLPKILSSILSLHPYTQDTLVILIKEFRITDKLVNEFNWNLETASLLNFSATFFGLRNSAYHRLFSIDDLLIQSWRETPKILSKKNIPPLRSEALTILLDKIFKNRSWTFSGISFSSAEVESGLQKRFALPILQDSSLTVGLYKSFSDFRNNQPSVTDIKITRKKYAVEVRDSQNKLIELKNFWGLSDGRNCFVVFRNNVCELLKIDKSFRFVSYRQMEDLHKKPDFGSSAMKFGFIPALLMSGNPKAYEYFYINMNKGEVYLEEWFGKSGLKSIYKDVLE